MQDNIKHIKFYYLLLLLDKGDNSIIPFPYLSWPADIVLLWYYRWSVLRITAQKAAEVLDNLGIGTWSFVFAHVQ